MAQATEMNTTVGALRATFAHAVEDIRASFAKRAVYRRTLAELASLSDRELADLGLTRFSIKDVAYQTAYDV